MHHPWRWLREHFPDWDVIYTHDIPVGELGCTDVPNRLFRIRPNLLQVQRRTVIDHELRHARDGDDRRQHPKREAVVNRESALALVPFPVLLEAWLWAYSVEEMAEECFVDVQTMRRRIDYLTSGERETIRCALAQRDFHEEGITDAGP
jgi:hypothetical protein